MNNEHEDDYIPRDIFDGYEDYRGNTIFVRDMAVQRFREAQDHRVNPAATSEFQFDPTITSEEGVLTRIEQLWIGETSCVLATTDIYVSDK